MDDVLHAHDDEPSGLGSQVDDNRGNRWERATASHANAWRAVSGPDVDLDIDTGTEIWATWDDIARDGVHVVRIGPAA